MRVDNVPVGLRPFFHLYGFGIGSLFYGIQQTIRHTCRFERSVVAAHDPRIECIWHEHLPAYMAAYLPPTGGRRYVWMNHPIWYMRPVHVLLTWSGVEAIALGSTGHGGQAALTQIVEYLRRGYSTLLAVDGPAGPPHVVKRGAFEMARMTGMPLVAIRFEYERAIRMGGWDRKAYPLPHSRVRIIESAPLSVNSESHEDVRDTIGRRLG